ncbi:MFS transporter [Streptococcus sp. CSL10205-OR2]|uniref:MFS transporter n=1 Tax=Streptococcus sp. CSL10205-OR2 TaxID=2980558 RepID=UPI0021D90C93|nr:MFS transporter [Streptococcus sp. CSL10205-OR2]MCU9533215.1 MFS transporter [Streptococcus sp. CSL10205-OR2]
MKKVFRNSLFMLSFLSDMISNFGDILYYYALMNYVLLIPETKIAVALVSISETLPIITGFVMGIYADKTKNKVDTILYTLIFRFFLYAVVGILMGFQPALWIVIIAILINLFSDVSGQYENGLFTPLSLRIVSDDDREAAISFRQAAGSALSIILQPTGAVLITWLSFQQLAFANAGTFALAGLIIYSIRTKLQGLLMEKPIEITTPESNQSIFKSMKENILLIFQELKKIPEVKFSMVIAPIFNGLFSILGVVVLLLINQDANFVILNVPTTIMALPLAFTLGTIIGSFLAPNVFKNISLIKMIFIIAFFPPIIFLCLLWHNSYVFMTFILIMAILSAVINPKMSAKLMNSLPEDKIASLMSGIGSYFQLGTIAARLLISALVIVLPLNLILITFLVGSILLLIYTIYKARSLK